MRASGCGYEVAVNESIHILGVTMTQSADNDVGPISDVTEGMTVIDADA
jgi:hypothetical protein